MRILEKQEDMEQKSKQLWEQAKERRRRKKRKEEKNKKSNE